MSSKQEAPPFTMVRDAYVTAWDLTVDAVDIPEVHAQARAEFDRFIAEIKADARCEAFQDAQQIIAGDCMVDEARDRDVDRVSVGRTIRELDVEIRDSVLRIEGEA